MGLIICCQVTAWSGPHDHRTDLGHTPPTNNRPSYVCRDPRRAIMPYMAQLWLNGYTPLPTGGQQCQLEATFGPSPFAMWDLLRIFMLDLNENSSSVCGWHRRAYAVCFQRIFSKMALRWRRGDKLLNKVVIFVFFAYKKYSRSFVKLRLNTLCHMDYLPISLLRF